jgi:hypothetical protein
MQIRYLIASALVAFSGNILGADEPFAGTWKLNTEHSQVNAFLEKIEDLGENKYRFTIGDSVEEIVLDGQEHPTSYGTWALKQEGPNKWTSVDKVNGKIYSTAVWTVSDDEKIFTSVTETPQADGSTARSEFKAKRLTGESGLVGSWGRMETKRRAPADWVIQPYEKDGLSFTSQSSKEHFSVKFDGKDYPDEGPSVPAGSTVSGRRLDERTIELYGTTKGTLTYSEHLQVSDDRKTMGVIVSLTGATASETDVFDRQ